MILRRNFPCQLSSVLGILPCCWYQAIAPKVRAGLIALRYIDLARSSRMPHIDLVIASKCPRNAGIRLFR